MSDYFLSNKKVDVHLECYPCFLRQVVIALDLSGTTGDRAEGVMLAAMAEVQAARGALSPAHITTHMHRTIRQMLGQDPFRAIKSKYNLLALELYPGLSRKVEESHEPLLTAARLAIAGNIIDFGIYRSVDIDGTVRRALQEPLDVDDSEAFVRAVDSATTIMYLLDNTGEAVLDRLLIEELVRRGKHVTAVAKGSAVINDCTVADAREAGINGACALIDNGSDAVGTILGSTPPEFQRAFYEADMIISKGQGNFETLVEEPREIFFLFQSKCKVVSEVLALPEGAMLLAHKQGVTNEGA